MERVSIRELRQNASQWIRRAKAGESFELTDRGQPVAMLGPLPPAGELARMIATGRARPAKGDLLDLGPPLPAEPGKLTLSEILEQMRADER